MIVKDWIDEVTGLRCVIKSNNPVPDQLSPWLCGYVAVPHDHPLFKVDYNTCAPILLDHYRRLRNTPMLDVLDAVGPINAFLIGTDTEEKPTPGRVLQIHGGITYAHFEINGVINGAPLWWFGFDCNHYNDDPITCNEQFVEDECVKLAIQLKAIQTEGCDNA